MSDPWIFSNPAASWLDATLEKSAGGVEKLQLVKWLRKSLTIQQAGEVMELADLRIRAAKKFSRAAEMFFTDRQLQQATGETISKYKARRFAPFRTVADLCCGIGGDAIAMDAHQDVHLVDLDPHALRMARHNVAVYGGEAVLHEQTADSIDVEELDAFHIDPDRRAPQLGGKRTVSLDCFSPSIGELKKLASKNPDFGLKLAPASTMWQGEYEIEFLGHQRECKQQVVWSGRLMTRPGRRATVLLDCGLQETFFVPLEDQNPKSVVGEELAGPVGDYIYDPHACLLASGLVEDFAVQMKMQLVSLQSGYLTSNQRSCSRLISGFRVLDVLKLNVKMIERYLKKHQVGQLELKKRGPLDQEFARLSRAQRTGSNRMTLILSGTPSGLRAIACRRIEDSAGAT